MIEQNILDKQDLFEINQHIGHFVDALKACSYNLDLENDNAYRFRTKRKLTNEEIAKNNAFLEQDGLSAVIVNPQPKNKIKHVSKTVKTTLTNHERLNTPVVKKSDDPSLYSSIDDSDMVANGFRMLHLITRKNTVHHGSRIMLERDPERFKEHDYLFFEDDRTLYKIQIGEEEKKTIKGRGDRHMRDILTKYVDKLYEEKQITLQKQEELRAAINTWLNDENHLIEFKKLLNNILEIDDISFGWADIQGKNKFKATTLAQYALLAKKVRKADSKILMMLGLTMLFAPVASVLLSVYISQRSARYVFIENEKALYRKSHLGYDPADGEMDAIMKCSWRFSYATLPCSTFALLSLIKDMSMLQISFFGLKTPGYDFNQGVTKPLEDLVSQCTTPLIENLLPWQARLVLAALTGATVAILVTMIAQLTPKNECHEMRPLWQVFGMGFVAGVLCFTATLIGQSEKVSWARVIEEVFYASTTFGLAYGLHKSKPRESLGSDSVSSGTREVMSFRKQDVSRSQGIPTVSSSTNVTSLPQANLAL